MGFSVRATRGWMACFVLVAGWCAITVVAHAARQPRPLTLIVVADPSGVQIDGQDPGPTPIPVPLPSLVELRSDLDNDGELETLHDADTVDADGTFTLSSLPGFVGDAVVTDSDSVAQSDAGLDCSEFVPGQIACTWQP